MRKPSAKPDHAKHPLRESFDAYVQNPVGVGAILLLLLIVLISIFGPGLYGVDSFEIVAYPLAAPGELEHVPLGSDFSGRDILAGLLIGGRATILVGLAAAAITVTIGVSVGAFAGYYQGVVDDVLMRITEFFQVLPPLVLAMVFVTVFSPSLETVASAIGIVSWPATARLTRAEFLRTKQLEYVAAARACGAKSRQIIWEVMLPNVLPPLVVSATITVGVAILFEAGLSFLGLSDPRVMSWGLMIGLGREYILSSWWVITLPGAAIFVTVLAISLIGDALNDAFNPKLRIR